MLHSNTSDFRMLKNSSHHVRQLIDYGLSLIFQKYSKQPCFHQLTVLRKQNCLSMEKMKANAGVKQAQVLVYSARLSLISANALRSQTWFFWSVNATSTSNF